MAEFQRKSPAFYQGAGLSNNIPTFNSKYGLRINASAKTIYRQSDLASKLDFREHSGVNIQDTEHNPAPSELLLDMEDQTQNFPPSVSGLIYDGNSIAMGNRYVIYDSARNNGSERMRTVEEILSAGSGSHYTWAYISDHDDSSTMRCIFAILESFATSWNQDATLGFYIQNDRYYIMLGDAIIGTGYSLSDTGISIQPGYNLFGVNSITGEFYINNQRVFNQADGYSHTYPSTNSLWFLMDPWSFGNYRYGRDIKIISHKQYLNISLSRTDFDNIWRSGPQTAQEKLLI